MHVDDEYMCDICIANNFFFVFLIQIYFYYEPQMANKSNAKQSTHFSFQKNGGHQLNL